MRKKREKILKNVSIERTETTSLHYLNTDFHRLEGFPQIILSHRKILLIL